jgi:hypothetical protein
MTCMILRSELHAFIVRSAYMETTNAGSTIRAIAKQMFVTNCLGCFGEYAQCASQKRYCGPGLGWECK